MQGADHGRRPRTAGNPGGERGSSSSSSSIYQIPNTEHVAYRLVRTLVYKRGVGYKVHPTPTLTLTLTPTLTLTLTLPLALTQVECRTSKLLPQP